MKSKLFIYSDTKIESFLRSLLSEFELVFMKFNDFDYKLYSSQPNIFILSDNKDVSLIDFKKLKNNCLIISNKNINNINHNNKLRVLKTPLTTNHIKKVLRHIFKKNIPPVLYGGSVDGSSINFFKDIGIIDGFLIGGASKSSKKFIDIIRNYYR